MLQLYRKQLDLLNSQLLRLLEIRGSVALEAMKFKHERNLPIHDPTREEACLAHCAKKLSVRTRPDRSN